MSGRQTPVKDESKPPKPDFNVEQITALLENIDYQKSGIINDLDLRRLLGHGEKGLTEKEINDLLTFTRTRGPDISINYFARNLAEDDED